MEKATFSNLQTYEYMFSITTLKEKGKVENFVLLLAVHVHAQIFYIIFRAAGCGKTFQPEELSTKLLDV